MAGDGTSNNTVFVGSKAPPNFASQNFTNTDNVVQNWALFKGGESKL